MKLGDHVGDGGGRPDGPDALGSVAMVIESRRAEATPRKRTERLVVTRTTPSGRRRRPDELIVEEPMTIQLDGTVVSTTMRTPGHDFELAAGFCFTEGLLAGAQVTGVRYCANGAASASAFNEVTVETGGRAPTPTPRMGTVSSSCGWCGSDQIEALVERLTPLPESSPISPDVLAGVPDRVLRGQGLFSSTGAVHAAAAFTTDGEVSVTREDVGRHNAVDKVVGALLLAGELPASGTLRLRAGVRGDGAEGLGGRVRVAGRGERTDRTRRARCSPRRADARRLRARRLVQPVRAVGAPTAGRTAVSRGRGRSGPHPERFPPPRRPARPHEVEQPYR